jgi:hypothetical protein
MWLTVVGSDPHSGPRWPVSRLRALAPDGYTLVPGVDAVPPVRNQLQGLWHDRRMAMRARSAAVVRVAAHPICAEPSRPRTFGSFYAMLAANASLLGCAGSACAASNNSRNSRSRLS